MTEREFCCVNCGLYFWEGIDYVTKMRYTYICPDCNANELVFAVDTFGWAMFYDNNAERFGLKDKSWSSKKYSPDFAIEHYINKGMTIR